MKSFQSHINEKAGNGTIGLYKKDGQGGYTADDENHDCKEDHPGVTHKKWVAASDDDVNEEVKHKVGDTVTAKVGPHKGQKHTVIHDHGDGRYNVQPVGLSPRQISYRLGAASAKGSDLEPHKSSKNEALDPATKSSAGIRAKFDRQGKIWDDPQAHHIKKIKHSLSKGRKEIARKRLDNLDLRNMRGNIPTPTKSQTKTVAGLRKAVGEEVDWDDVAQYWSEDTVADFLKRGGKITKLKPRAARGSTKGKMKLKGVNPKGGGLRGRKAEKKMHGEDYVDEAMYDPFNDKPIKASGKRPFTSKEKTAMKKFNQRQKLKKAGERYRADLSKTVPAGQPYSPTDAAYKKAKANAEEYNVEAKASAGQVMADGKAQGERLKKAAIARGETPTEKNPYLTGKKFKVTKGKGSVKHEPMEAYHNTLSRMASGTVEVDEAIRSKPAKELQATARRLKDLSSGKTQAGREARTKKREDAERKTYGGKSLSDIAKELKTNNVRKVMKHAETLRKEDVDEEIKKNPKFYRTAQDRIKGAKPMTMSDKEVDSFNQRQKLKKAGERYRADLSKTVPAGQPYSKTDAAYKRKKANSEEYEYVYENVAYLKNKEGHTFVVSKRDTKGMRGKQDKFSMSVVDGKGKLVKDHGSHVSVAGAKKYATSRGYSEEVEIDEIGPALALVGRGALAVAKSPTARKIAFKVASKSIGKAITKRQARRDKEREQEQGFGVNEPVTEGTWERPDSMKQMKELAKLMKKPLLTGSTKESQQKNSAEGKLYSIIGDDELFDAIDFLRDKKGEKADVRPLVRKAMKRLEIDPDRGLRGESVDVDEATKWKNRDAEKSYQAGAGRLDNPVVGGGFAGITLPIKGSGEVKEVGKSVRKGGKTEYWWKHKSGLKNVYDSPEKLRYSLRNDANFKDAEKIVGQLAGSGTSARVMRRANEAVSVDGRTKGYRDALSRIAARHKVIADRPAAVTAELPDDEPVNNDASADGAVEEGADFTDSKKKYGDPSRSGAGKKPVWGKGDLVKVVHPQRGKGVVKGKVVRHDKGMGSSGSPFYVIAIPGVAQSVKVSDHNMIGEARSSYPLKGKARQMGIKPGKNPNLRAADPKDVDMDDFLKDVSAMIGRGAKPDEVRTAIQQILPLMKKRGIKVTPQQKAALKKMGIKEEFEMIDELSPAQKEKRETSRERYGSKETQVKSSGPFGLKKTQVKRAIRPEPGASKSERRAHSKAVGKGIDSKNRDPNYVQGNLRPDADVSLKNQNNRRNIASKIKQIKQLTTDVDAGKQGLKKSNRREEVEMMVDEGGLGGGTKSNVTKTGTHSSNLNYVTRSKKQGWSDRDRSSAKEKKLASKEARRAGKQETEVDEAKLRIPKETGTPGMTKARGPKTPYEKSKAFIAAHRRDNKGKYPTQAQHDKAIGETVDEVRGFPSRRGRIDDEGYRSDGSNPVDDRIRAKNANIARAAAAKRKKALELNARHNARNAYNKDIDTSNESVGEEVVDEIWRTPRDRYVKGAGGRGLADKSAEAEKSNNQTGAEKVLAKRQARITAAQKWKEDNNKKSTGIEETANVGDKNAPATSQDMNYLSDFHKDVYGTRPRGTYKHVKTVGDYHKEIESLSRAAEAEQKQVNQDRVERKKGKATEKKIQKRRTFGPKGGTSKTTLTPAFKKALAKSRGLHEDDPRLVKKYTEKPGPGLSARKPTVTTGKAGATKHTGPTASTPASSPGEERVRSKLRDSRFAANSLALKNRAALKKRSAMLNKGPKRRK